jgi:hypothetical protein
MQSANPANKQPSNNGNIIIIQGQRSQRRLPQERQTLLQGVL